MAVPFYIPASNVQALLFLHFLVNTCYFLFFFSPFNLYKPQRQCVINCDLTVPKTSSHSCPWVTWWAEWRGHSLVLASRGHLLSRPPVPVLIPTPFFLSFLVCSRPGGREGGSMAGTPGPLLIDDTQFPPGFSLTLKSLYPAHNDSFSSSLLRLLLPVSPQVILISNY